VREKIAGSRVVRWASRHRGPAAVLGGLVLTFKAYKWLIPWLVNAILNPREGVASVREHWELLAAGSAVVFVFGFVTVRFGLDWLDRLDAVNRRLAAANDGDGRLIAAGPAWLEREELPPRMQIPPRLG
jgi:hypothetical protein